ncbi:MAG: BREX system ATP-binding domain-containing protein [Candidatus Natronoplasma sp.]
MVSIELEDLILMLLEDFEEFKDEEEVPLILTPRELTKTVGIEKSEPYSVLDEMEEKGLICKECKYIPEYDRKRNVYFLTEKGSEREKDTWRNIKDEEVMILTEDDEKNLKLKNIENHISGRYPTVKGLREMDENDVIDLTEIENDIKVFVGRKKELKELEDDLKRVKKEGAKTVLIEGEAGIGKTSLVQKLKPLAEDLGFEFLSGKCQSEGSDPYLPFRDAFTEYIEEGSSKKLGANMAFIGRREENILEEKNIFDAQKKETFFDTSRYVQELADENPLLIFLDDLQWVDRATLEILTYMDEKLEDSPVLFLGTYRPEDISKNHPLTEMIQRLERENRLKTIVLEPLSYEDTENTVKGVLGGEDIPKEFVEVVHQKTDGNPLFIKESIRQMLEEGVLDVDEGEFPHSSDDVSISGLVHNVIGRRLNRLDDETVKVVKMGSVIGDNIPFDLLSETVDMSEIDLLDHIDMLTGNNIWEEDFEEERFYFSHELIKDTAYKDVRGMKKKILHRRVAENIEKIYEKELENWYSNLARHHKEAEDFSKALEYYLKEGEKAEKVYANEDAIDMYEEALELCDKAGGDEINKLDITKKITKAYSLLGEYEKTRDYLNRGLELTEDWKEKQKIYKRIAESYYEQGDWESALKYIEEGLSVASEQTPEECDLLSLKGMIQIQKGDYDKAEEIFKREKEVAEEIGAKEKMGQVYHDLGSTALRKGKIDNSISKLQKAIEIKEDNDDLLGLQKSYNNIGIAYADKANFRKAEKYYRNSLEVCKEVGDKSGTSASLNNLGTIQMKKGDLSETIDTFEKSFDISDKLGDKHGKAISLSNLANIYQVLGDFSSAEEALEKSREIAEDLKTKNLIATTQTIRGTLQKKRGDLESAIEQFKECYRVSEEIGNQMNLSLSLLEIGEIEILRGNYEEAKEKMLEAERISDRLGAKEIGSAVKDGLGRLYLNEGYIEKATEQHRKGLEIAEDVSDIESRIQNQIGLAEDLLENEEIERSEVYCSEAGESLQGREDPLLKIRNQLVKAKIQRKKRNFENAKDHLERSLEKSRETRNKVMEAKTLYEYGLLSLEKEEYSKVKDHLENANEMFEMMGMDKYKERSEEKLKEI